MKKRMLVGAAGLALAGVAIAADGIRPTALDSETFLKMRDSALGEPGSSARADVLRQIRREIELGNIDPRTVVFTITEDLIPGSGQPPADLSLNSGLETGGGAPFFGNDGFAGFVLGDYSNAPTSNISLSGQSNVFGVVVGADPWVSAATDAVMANNTSGPGGTQLTGNQPLPHLLPNGDTQFEPYGALARRTGADNLTTAFALAMNFRFPLISPGPGTANHSRISTDWYIIDQDTSQWWSPVSFTEGFVSDRLFFGGTQIGGVLGFAEDANGILNNFVSLGNLPGNFTIGQFYAPPRNSSVFPFPVGEWFQIMAVLVSTQGGGFGQGIFIRTAGTVAAGVQDPRMNAGIDQIMPPDKDPVGWLNTYPGIADDPGTVGVVEGIGLAQTQFGVDAPTTGAFGLGPLFAAATLSGVQFGEGLDPPQSVVAGFQWDDAFIDNFRVAGQTAAVPTIFPDFINPYLEDMESYFGGLPIRFQTNRIFDANSSNALVFNGGPGTGQSLANQNLNSDGLFRQENNSAVPTSPVRARGKALNPAVVEVKIQNTTFGGLPVSGRAIRVSDGLETGGLTSVIYGGLDPTIPSVDTNIWVRQPNTVQAIPGNTNPLDPNKDTDDNIRQVNAIPTALWAVQAQVPPGPLNFTFENVDTGLSVPGSGVAQTVRMEFEPNPNQDDNQFNDEGLVNILLNGVQVPGAQPGGKWIASGTSVSTIQIWSGNQLNGNGEVLAVDDFVLSGGAFFEAQGGTPFSLPFLEDFDSYDAGFTVDEAGSTPFRALASMPDAPANDNSRQLTVKTGASPLVDGELVCRYEVVTVPLDISGIVPPITVGDVFAVSLDDVPDVFNNLDPSNTDCPGSGTTPPPDPVSPPGAAQPTDFVLRDGAAVDPVTGTVTAENTPRLAEGTWKLLNTNNDPIAFVSAGSTDRQELAFSFYNESRWEGTGTQTIVRADPTAGPLGSPGVPGNQVLEVNSVDADGTLNDFIMFGVVSSRLPDAIATSASDIAEMTARVYIESLDANGNPIVAAPRSRMEIDVRGATADLARIVRVMLGGPNVNKRDGLQNDANGNPLPGAPPTSGPGGTEPDDRIWVTRPSSVANPDFEYLPTSFSLLGGGVGPEGAITGPLVNVWFTVRVRVFSNDTWEVALDEGNGFVTIASGTALDAGTTGQAGTTANTSGMGSFNVNIGNDFGSGGSPIPNPFRIHQFYDPSVNGLSEDADGDGSLDGGVEDVDGDGNFDNVDEDTNLNGVLDAGEDLDGDGKLDTGEDVNFNNILDAGEDLDGDGVLDRTEDLDGDANFDIVNEDLDGDGLLDLNIGAGRAFDSVAPAGLNSDTDAFTGPNDDYCFYETTIRDNEDPDFFDKALLLDVDPVTGVITQAFGANPRPINQNNDTIAVINRPIDPGLDGIAGTDDDFVVPGSAKIHDPCPINISIPINQFELFKGDGTATVSFAGRWLLDGQAGQAGTNNPNPPGGVNRPNGPRALNLSYNDPSVVAADFPGGPRRLGMVLAQWGDGVTPGDTGVDATGTAFPPQRWFFDDVTLAVVQNCPQDLNGDGTVNGADITFILAKFNQPGAGQPEDLNGDGVINSGDITPILNAFGPCP